MAVRLVDNWRQAWRFWSARVCLAAVAFGSLTREDQQALLDAIRLPEHRVALVLGVVGLITRMVYQRSLHKPKDPPQDPPKGEE